MALEIQKIRRLLVLLSARLCRVLRAWLSAFLTWTSGDLTGLFSGRPPPQWARQAHFLVDKAGPDVEVGAPDIEIAAAPGPDAEVGTAEPVEELAARLAAGIAELAGPLAAQDKGLAQAAHKAAGPLVVSAAESADRLVAAEAARADKPEVDPGVVPEVVLGVELEAVEHGAARPVQAPARAVQNSHLGQILRPYYPPIGHFITPKGLSLPNS